MEAYPESGVFPLRIDGVQVDGGVAGLRDVSAGADHEQVVLGAQRREIVISAAIAEDKVVHTSGYGPVVIPAFVRIDEIFEHKSSESIQCHLRG